MAGMKEKLTVVSIRLYPSQVVWVKERSELSSYVRELIEQEITSFCTKPEPNKTLIPVVPKVKTVKTVYKVMDEICHLPALFNNQLPTEPATPVEPAIPKKAVWVFPEPIKPKEVG